MLLYPKGASETELLLSYGSTCFSSKVGQLAGNHFLTMTSGVEQLSELGRRVLWEGAQDILIELGTSDRPVLSDRAGRAAAGRAQAASEAARLLERYVAAKDGNRPHLMEQIYAPDAVLTYSIATDSISFPARTVGLEAITRTLVVDFGQRFTRCRTYYVVDNPPAGNASIPFIPWLVLMREEARSRPAPGQGILRLDLRSRRHGSAACDRDAHPHRPHGSGRRPDGDSCSARCKRR